MNGKVVSYMKKLLICLLLVLVLVLSMPAAVLAVDDVGPYSVGKEKPKYVDDVGPYITPDDSAVVPNS